MCTGHAPHLEEKSSFVGRWMDMLKPGYERVKDITDTATRTEALEKEAILISLENLMSFPFVKSLVERDEMTLHGLWNDIGDGSLEQYDPATRQFLPI
jgi:carbonic anhydrase